MANKVVTFLQDVYPYCRGDVRRLETTVLADIDKVAKAKKLGTVYVDGEQDVRKLEGDAEAGVNAAKAAIRQGLPSVKAAVTDLDVAASHEEKTILGSDKVGVDATPTAVSDNSATPATTQPVGQAAETLPATKQTSSKKAVKSNTTTPASGNGTSAN